MEEILLYFKKLLPCKQFVVTGSYSFKTMGLASKAGDLDTILVSPTNESLDILDRLQGDSDIKEDYPERPDKHFKLSYNNVKIDIFTSDTPRDAIKLENGLELSTVKETIRAKKGYGRLKDWLQLMQCADLFFTQKEFDEFLSKERRKIQ